MFLVEVLFLSARTRSSNNSSSWQESERTKNHSAMILSGVKLSMKSAPIDKLRVNEKREALVWTVANGNLQLNGAVLLGRGMSSRKTTLEINGCRDGDKPAELTQFILTDNLFLIFRNTVKFKIHSIWIFEIDNAVSSKTYWWHKIVLLSEVVLKTT